VNHELQKEIFKAAAWGLGIVAICALLYATFSGSELGGVFGTIMGGIGAIFGGLGSRPDKPGPENGSLGGSTDTGTAIKRHEENVAELERVTDELEPIGAEIEASRAEIERSGEQAGDLAGELEAASGDATDAADRLRKLAEKDRV